MLKIRRKLQLQRLTQQNQKNKSCNPTKSNIHKWIQEQLSCFNYSLSNQNSQFYVNNLLKQSNKLIIIQMYIKPKIGIFKDIQFRPKMYISSIDLVKRPKIYNDRRIYHPNINIQTLQIIFHQLVVDWNPTKKLQYILRNLNYILIEANVSFVPNNDLNKRAAIQYHFKRDQYRDKIFQNMPIALDKIVIQKINQKKQVNSNEHMELEQEQSQLQSKDKQSQWFDIKSLYPKKIYTPKSAFTSYFDTPSKGKRNLDDIQHKDQQQIKILSKQMKKIHFASDNQTQTNLNMQLQ